MVESYCLRTKAIRIAWQIFYFFISCRRLEVATCYVDICVVALTALTDIIVFFFVRGVKNYNLMFLNEEDYTKTRRSVC